MAGATENQQQQLPIVLERVLECKQGAVRCVRYNVDGGYCLSCGSDKSVKLWNPNTGALLHTFAGHGYEVLDARGSVDNSLIASCGLDKSVMVWDVTTGQCRLKLRGHAARVTCVCFTEDSHVVLSASVDGSVKCWDLRSRKFEPIQTLDEAKDSVMSVTVSGHQILTASLDTNTRLYDLRNGSLTTNCLGESVTCSSLSGDAQCVLAATVNSGLRLMDKQTGELLASYRDHKTTDYKVECCFSESDTHVFSGSEDAYVYCWDLISSNLTHRLHHPGGRVVHSLSPHPSQPKLLTATLGQVWLWGPPPPQEQE
uniref:WD repeat domain-containing protein 83 n=1 Tax=Hirondellea gigas TaxID=1518452 RepID=A0A2P2I443_9CRUS